MYDPRDDSTEKVPNYGLTGWFSARMPQSLDDREIIEQIVDDHLVKQEQKHVKD